MLLFNSKALLSQWKPRDAAGKVKKFTAASRGPPCDSTVSCYEEGNIGYNSACMGEAAANTGIFAHDRKCSW